uniref:Protein yippee-like n=1 Tax=Esox lucius TaxID=8010 RepID=A0AAY5KDA3_ESOLU
MSPKRKSKEMLARACPMLSGTRAKLERDRWSPYSTFWKPALRWAVLGVLLSPFSATLTCTHTHLRTPVVNLQYSEVQDRVMLTGRHMVRDVSCKNCNSKLGWIYEFATEDSQRYKEGRVILERALVRESEGFEEHVPSDNS